MRTWILLLGGLTIWALHFFTIYAIASLFPGTERARVLTVLATLCCLAIGGLLLRWAWGRRQSAGPDRLSRWMSGVALGGAALALVAIAFQGMPALLL